MFYAERLGDRDKGEDYIAERGMFFNIEEYVPFRLLGWSASAENDRAADEEIARAALAGKGD